MDISKLKWYRRDRLRYAFGTVTGLALTDTPVMFSTRDGSGSAVTMTIGVPPIDLGEAPIAMADIPPNQKTVTVQVAGEQFLAVDVTKVVVK